MRVAFSADEASAMRDATWAALADAGITRSDPSTWTRERPEYLQQLKAPPAFRAIGNSRSSLVVSECRIRSRSPHGDPEVTCAADKLAVSALNPMPVAIFGAVFAAISCRVQRIWSPRRPCYGS